MNEAITKIILTSAISGLIIFISLYIMKLLHPSVRERAFYFLSTRNKAIVGFLVLLLFALPAIFSLPTGSWLSPSITATFVREVFVSIVILASSYVSWMILSESNSLSASYLKKISLGIKTWSYRSLQSFHSLYAINRYDHKTTSDLNEILVQWDAGEVTEIIAKKEQILYSLRKWIEIRNESGWFELNEQIHGALTDSPASWIVIKELDKIQKQRMEGRSSIRNHNFEKRLESLIAIESVGEVWQKWDKGLVPEDAAHEAQEVNAFKKWMLNGDETGWVYLQSICQNRKSLTPKVTEFAGYELQEIARRRKRHETIDKGVEKRLRRLVLG